jgi:hypothetical protein
MKNSKWVKLVSKEDILKMRNVNDFTFSIVNLASYFNIPSRRMSELIKYYGIEIKKLTKNKKLSKEEWLEECIKQHGNYFDYSMTEYTKLNSTVEIGCPEHGIIKVNAISHKNGGGCKRCNSKKKSIFKPLSKEEFIKYAMITHDNYYDYSKVEDFTDTHEKVTIICPVHGEFKQKVYSHRYGSGCEKCSYIQRGLNGRVSFKEYVKRAFDKFGEKYEYIEDSYTTINNKISYICNIHGIVTQKAETHLKSQGCAKCFTKNEKHTTDSFIEKASLKHGNFYNYDKTVYGNSNTDKVIITCPFHGDFKQAPMGHLSGQGCKSCAIIKSNIGYKNLIKEDIENSKNINCKVYVLKLKAEYLEYYKIGISTNFKERCKKLKNAHKANIDVLYTLDSNLFECAKIESELLEKYKEFNKKGEVPFGIEGSTECLSINTPIEEIVSHLSKPLP